LQSNVECIFYLNIKIKLQKLLEQRKNAKEERAENPDCIISFIVKAKHIGSSKAFYRKVSDGQYKDLSVNIVTETPCCHEAHLFL